MDARPLSAIVVVNAYPHGYISTKEIDMCRAATCKTCGKTTWAGCGQHVDQVMRNVPAGQRCPGHAESEKASGPGFLSRILGRG